MKKLFVALFVLPILMLCSCGKSAQMVCASVNGEPITADEIEYFKSRYRGDIINDYAEKYGIKEFSDFWDTPYDGLTPAQALSDRALEEAVSAKVRLLLMRENGIYDDISYAALLERANKFNADSKNVSGVVGLKSIDINGFYTYYIATGEMELKNLLAEGSLKPTEKELSAAAKQHPVASENSLISSIVSEKYEKMIAAVMQNAKIEIF